MGSHLWVHATSPPSALHGVLTMRSDFYIMFCICHFSNTAQFLCNGSVSSRIYSACYHSVTVVSNLRSQSLTVNREKVKSMTKKPPESSPEITLRSLKGHPWHPAKSQSCLVVKSHSQWQSATFRTVAQPAQSCCPSPSPPPLLPLLPAHQPLPHFLTVYHPLSSSLTPCSLPVFNFPCIRVILCSYVQYTPLKFQCHKDWMIGLIVWWALNHMTSKWMIQFLGYDSNCANRVQKSTCIHVVEGNGWHIAFNIPRALLSCFLIGECQWHLFILLSMV